MYINAGIYSGRCDCGRTHEIFTKAAIIEPGCLSQFEMYMENYGISGKRCALYAHNTFAAAEGKRPSAEQTILIDPNGLHADEKSTAEVLEKLECDVEVILAIGSGTIHDIARYCANARGIRFVSVPTAASVDGFCSTVAAMTWYGFKKTMPAVAPEIVIADIDIIKKAPPELVRSGVGDIIAKYTALADWEISNAVTGEYLCRKIYDIMRLAADATVESISGILEQSDDAYVKVMFALVMSGIAMQMMGNSRPASGAEHHIAHLTEMKPAAFEVRFPALHGEKTGVGSVVASREYHRLAEITDISPLLRDYIPVTTKDIRAFFGGTLAESIIKENKHDCLKTVTKASLGAAWPQIREIVSTIPSPERIEDLLSKLGAKKSLENIGISDTELDSLLNYAPLVRNRLTLMRMRRLMNFEEPQEGADNA